MWLSSSCHTYSTPLWASCVYFAAHGIAAIMGPQKTKALAIFHAFTGCDVTSSVAEKGKKTSWDTWGVYPDATDTFLALSQCPTHFPADVMIILERFVVLKYDRSIDQHKVNDARQYLFARKFSALENIPPTQSSLKQHALRVAYQWGHVWGKPSKETPRYPVIQIGVGRGIMDLPGNPRGEQLARLN